MVHVLCLQHKLRASEIWIAIVFLYETQTEFFISFFVFFFLLTHAHRAEGAHAVAALLPRQVILIAYGAHTIGSWVAIETAARGTKHGHLALVRLLGHC